MVTFCRNFAVAIALPSVAVLVVALSWTYGVCSLVARARLRNRSL
jgi:hypothetical protein